MKEIERLSNSLDSVSRQLTAMKDIFTSLPSGYGLIGNKYLKVYESDAKTIDEIAKYHEKVFKTNTSHADIVRFLIMRNAEKIVPITKEAQ